MMFALCVHAVNVAAQDDKAGAVLLALTGPATITSPENPTRDGMSARVGMRLAADEILVNEAGSRAQVMLLDGAVLLLGSNARFGVVADQNGEPTRVTVADGDFRFASAATGSQQRTINFGDSVVDISDGEVAGRWNRTQNPHAGEVFLIAGKAVITSAGATVDLTRPGFGVPMTVAGDLQPPRPVTVAQIHDVARGVLGFDPKAGSEFEALATRQRTALGTAGQSGGGNAGGNAGTGQTVNVDVDAFLTREVLQRPQLAQTITEVAPNSLRLRQGAALVRGRAFGRRASEWRQFRARFERISGSTRSERPLVADPLNPSLLSVGAVSDPLSEALGFAADRRVASISAVDKRGLPVTYSMLTNPGNRFRVGADGGLFMRAGSTLDFETEPQITARVQARNAIGETLATDVVLTVTNANDAPSGVTLSRASLPDATTPHFVDRETGNLMAPFVNFNHAGWVFSHDVQPKWSDSWDGSANVMEKSADGSTLYLGRPGMPIGPQAAIRPSATLPTLTAQETAAGTIFVYGFDWNSPSDSCSGGSGSCPDSYQIYPFSNDQNVTQSGTPSVGSHVLRFEEHSYSMGNSDPSFTIIGRNKNDSTTDGAGRPSISNPFLQFKYKKSQPIVIGSLGATDDDSFDTHSFTLTSDPSNLFELRGNMLVLKRSDSLNASTTPFYDLGFSVQDQAGATSALTLRVLVTDAGGTSQVLREAASGTQGTAMSMDVDFATAGATITGANLPTWMTLQDLGNGLARLSGTPAQSGTADFTVISTKDSVETAAKYRLTAAENCTSSYCEKFASSTDTQTILTAGDLTSANFANWTDYHTTFSSGTGQYSHTGTLTSSNGTWSGSVAAEINFGTRTATIQSTGTFSGYTDGNGATTSGSWSAAFTNQTFGDGGSGCGVTPGACTFTAPHSGAVGAGIDLKTCTGSSGSCTANNHASVAIAPEITVQAKTVSAGAASATHAMLTETAIRDRNATTSSTVQANSNGAQLMVAQ